MEQELETKKILKEIKEIKKDIHFIKERVEHSNEFDKSDLSKEELKLVLELEKLSSKKELFF